MKKINFYCTRNRDIGFENLMLPVVFCLKNLLKFTEHDNIVAAMVLAGLESMP